MKTFLSVAGLCGLIFVIIFAFLYFLPGPATASPNPAKFEIYFLTLGDKGQLVAYGPNYSVNVTVNMDVIIGQYNPYVEVPKKTTSKPIKWLSKAEEEEFVAWGYGGILHVQDRKQLEELLLR